LYKNEIASQCIHCLILQIGLRGYGTFANSSTYPRIICNGQYEVRIHISPQSGVEISIPRSQSSTYYWISAFWSFRHFWLRLLSRWRFRQCSYVPWIMWVFKKYKQLQLIIIIVSSCSDAERRGNVLLL